MGYDAKPAGSEESHRLTLEDRSRLTLSGVREVERFDEQIVVLHTVRGTLVVRGEDLQLQLLSLEGGQVHVDGTVDSLTYEDSPRSGQGLMARLFG